MTRPAVIVRPAGRGAITYRYDADNDRTVLRARTTPVVLRVKQGRDGSSGGVSDHGALTGLADDDHTQYALADGSRGTFEAAGAVATHEADTTSVHGIADTADLIVEGDSRLSDARSPTAHAASHGDGGTDEISVDASQVTTGTVATARLGSGTADSSTYLRGDQTWAAVGTTLPTGGAAGDIVVKQSSTDGDADWESLETASVQRAGTLVSFGGASTVTTQRRIFYLGAGTITLPLVADVPNQEFLINPVAGPGVTLQASGSDIFPLSSSATFDVVGGSPTTFTAVPGVGWVPDVRSGIAYDIPYFAGLGIPDGRVVALSSGLPAWVDPNLLVDAGSDPDWGPEPTVTTKVMRLDYAGNAGTDDGAWSTPNIGDLTSGVDLRALVWFDYPSDLTQPVADTYMEVLTQTNVGAGGGDNFEAAVVWGTDDLSGLIAGQPHTFWEALPTGGSTETNAGWTRAGLTPRTWVALRWTQDLATGTVTYWRSVPYQVTDGCELVDGTWYYPVSSVVDTDFETIQTGIVEDWWIGKRFTGYLASMRLTPYGSATKLVDIQPATLDALPLGTTSFADTAGSPNTWTTDAAAIATPPRLGESVISLLVTDPNGADITTGDGQAWFTVPSELDGWTITDVNCSLTTPGTTTGVTVQVHNATDAVDVLSTACTTDATEATSYTATTPAVVNTSSADLATGDQLRIDVDAVPTGAKGLQVMVTVAS